MICFGCLKENTSTGFCQKCKKVMFDGKKISHILTFSKPVFDSFVRDSNGRFSISGVQDKISLRIDNGKLSPTQNDGEYILKPRPSSLSLVNRDDIVANEHVTMQIASQVYKINTASNVMVQFDDGEFAYLTKRFDRNKDGTKNRQEDFCQILNKTEEIGGKNYKYDGYYTDAKKVFEDYVALKDINLEQYFKIVVFNYIFHNGDAHFKNFSLSEGVGGMSLSPTYDLLNTRLHSPNETSIALDGLFPGDTDTDAFMQNGFYSRIHFLMLADKLGVKPNRALRIIENFTENIPAALKLIDVSFLNSSSKDKYKAYVQDRTRAMTNLFGVNEYFNTQVKSQKI